MNNSTKGEDFLIKLYNDLPESDLVKYYKQPNDKKSQSVKRSLDRLEHAHNKAFTTDRMNLLYGSYFNKFVIKEENIPNKLPDGYTKESIIEAQKKSLKMWIDYLSDPSASYPMWAKYWVFRGMLKMGSYDPAKKTYNKRDEKTINPFPEANPEIIANVISTIVKLVNNEQVEGFTKSSTVKDIYTFYEKKVKENQLAISDSIEGTWIKYNQGSKEDAKRLSKSLEGYNTHWCTAQEDMAIDQVCGPYNDAPKGGDFYVYYTKNENNEYKCHRIAIRLSGKDGIGEIRGIADGQNLEECMISVLEQKLKEMTFLKEEDVKEYLDIINGLTELSIIEQKTAKKEPLIEQEVTNLYTKKYGFGWVQDPRVGKVIQKRNVKEDFDRFQDYDTKVNILQEGFIIDPFIEDRDFMLRAIDDYPRVFKYATEKLRNDRELVLTAVKNGGGALQYASDDLKNDPEIVLIALKHDITAMQYASEELKNNKDFVLRILKDTNNLVIQYTTDDLRKDFDFMLEVVKFKGLLLLYASNDLKDNFQIVLEAVKNDGRALKCASNDLKNNFQIVLEAVKNDGRALEYASNDLKNNFQIVLEAVKKDSYALDYASKELRNNPEIVLTALRTDNSTQRMCNCGFLLSFASDNLRNNPEIVKEAVFNSPNEFKSASLELKGNYEFVMELLKNGTQILKYVSKKLNNNPKIVLTAIKNSPEELQYASERLRKDKKFIYNLCLEDPNYIDYSLLNEKEKKRILKKVELTAMLNKFKAVKNKKTENEVIRK